MTENAQNQAHKSKVIVTFLTIVPRLRLLALLAPCIQQIAHLVEKRVY